MILYMLYNVSSRYMQGIWKVHTKLAYGTHKVSSMSQYGQNNFIFYGYEKLILLYKIYIYIKCINFIVWLYIYHIMTLKVHARYLKGTWKVYERCIYGTHKVSSISQYGQNNFIFYSFWKLKNWINIQINYFSKK